MNDQTIKSYKDLKVWQDAMTLAESCYQLTGVFPKEEMFGSTSQIRRSAVSIPANIAEGHGRETTGNFIKFLLVAQGSLKELETHHILAERVGTVKHSEEERVLGQCDGIGRILRALIRSLQQKRQGR